MPDKRHGAGFELRKLLDRLSANPFIPNALPSRHLSYAFAAALAFIGLLTFVVLPARDVTVVADGASELVKSREVSDAALMRQAGVELNPGDIVVRKENRDGEPMLVVQRATPVVVESSGQLVYWRSRAKTIAGALAEIGVSLNEGDKVLVNGILCSPRDLLVALPARMVSDALTLARVPEVAVPTNDRPLAITVKRAVPFTVREDGHLLEFRSTQPTLALALKENGISLGEGDIVSPELETPLTAGLVTDVEHASKIDVIVADVGQDVYTHEKTVGKALETAGIILTALDKVLPDREQPIVDGMSIYVTRVTVGSYVERESIAFETVFKSDANLDFGETRRVAGQEGTLVREYEVTFENGQEAGRTLLQESVEAEAVDAIVYYGTDSALGSDTIPDGLNVIKVMHVYATWYNPRSAGGNITSTGVPVTKGIVAVDPTVIPYGTRMYIPGYGFGVAADCGGGVKGNMIDLGYANDDYVDWRSRYVDIYIVG